jgi:non-heme chloroperoxidase
MHRLLRRLTLSFALFFAAPAVIAAPSVEWVDGAGGVPLCVFEAGVPTAPAIVFLHGFSQSHAVFKRQYGGPLALRYRLIGIDLRGHGCSGKPWTLDAYSTPRVWAQDLEAVFKAKHVRRPLVVAWSFGAYIVADYVRTFGTHSLAGAVLVGSTAALLPPDVDPAAKRRRAYSPSPPVDSGLELETAARDASTFVRLMAARPLDADLADIMRTAALQLPAYASRAMTARELRNDDLVARFDLPTRFFVGAHDRANPPELMDQAAARLPRASVVRFAESGHSPFAEEPAAFNEALGAFAGEVVAGPESATPATPSR